MAKQGFVGAIAFACIVGVGCGAASGDGTGEAAGPGNGGGSNIDAGAPRPDAGNCGAQQEPIELINLGDPPDMLIVLDRSGSMNVGPGIFPLPLGDTKWKIMRDALTALTNARENNIRFGLSVFPTDNACGVSSGAAVDVDLGNAGAIQSWLSSNGADGNTPAHQGLAEALAIYNSMPVNPEGRYVLFATDGAPNCNPTVDDSANPETVAAVAALKSAGIDTFVLGFGDSTFLDTGVLNDAAQAGGQARASSPYYYDAEDAAALETALDTIAGGIITPSCSYELASLPPDPDLVTVTADGVPVPRSPSKTNGWEYHPDSSTITFFGSYCSDIESGTISSVDFIFGCPGPIAQ